MITLKLATYSQTEVDELAELLETCIHGLSIHCKQWVDCKECPYRHLCTDLSQATMYADEYKVIR